MRRSAAHAQHVGKTDGSLKNGGGELEHLRTSDGVDLAYRVSGPESGPVVAFTHGASMDHRMWESQVEALSDRYRVLVHDVRGHGDSQCTPDQFTPRAAANDLIVLLDAVGAERAVFVGHSLGGIVSQIAALEHPKRLSAFAGIGCGCVTMKPSVTMRLFSLIAAPAARRMGPERMRQDAVMRAGVQPSTRSTRVTPLRG